MSDASVYDPGDGNFLVIDGHIVERDALRIAEKIKEFDPNLELLCLDPDYIPDVNEAPFVVCEYVNGVFKRVLEAWTLDDTILQRLQYARNFTIDELCKKVDDLKQVQYDRVKSKYKDAAALRQDLTAHIVDNRTSRYSFKDEETGEKVTIFDDRPPERHGFRLTKDNSGLQNSGTESSSPVR